MTSSELRERKVARAKNIYVEIYNTKHCTDFPPAPTEDQLVLVTVDYIRNKTIYNQELSSILERTPGESYVKRNPTLKSNKKAIMEAFESTVFSVILKRMPPRY